MGKDFIIGQVSWLTEAERNYEFDSELCCLAFTNMINYLQINKLTTRTILAENKQAQESICVKVSDLTDEGFLLVKKCFDKWLDKVIDEVIVYISANVTPLFRGKVAAN